MHLGWNDWADEVLQIQMMMQVKVVVVYSAKNFLSIKWNNPIADCQLKTFENKEVIGLFLKLRYL